MNWVWRGVAPGLDAGEPTARRCTVCTPANVDDLLDATARYGGRARRRGRLRAGRAAAASSSASRPRRRCRSGGSRTRRSPATARAATASTSSASSACASSSGFRATSRSPSQPGSDELSPLLRGTVVHELLERLDFADAARADARGGRRRGSSSHGADAGGAAVEDTRRFVTAFLGSAAARAARGRAAGAQGARLRLRASRRRRPGGGACSSTASWTCTPRRTTAC